MKPGFLSVIGLIVLSALLNVTAIGADSYTPAQSREIEQKLKNIKLKRIEFEEVKIATVIKYLRARSKSLDPEGAGVNIFSKLSKKENNLRVTMVVDNVTLGDAIRYICRAANLKYRIDKHAVVIYSPEKSGK